MKGAHPYFMPLGQPSYWFVTFLDPLPTHLDGGMIKFFLFFSIIGIILGLLFYGFLFFLQFFWGFFLCQYISLFLFAEYYS